MTLQQHPLGLSLLTTVRGRSDHLCCLLSWLERIRRVEAWTDFELIIIEGDTAPRHKSITQEHDWVTYAFEKQTQAFHKTSLLNAGLSMARGEFIMPLDVDLLPAQGVLQRHLALTMQSSGMLVSGYRVLLEDMPAPSQALPSSEQLFEQARNRGLEAISSEDGASALRKYLLHGERFGVSPCFPSSDLQAVGGWDEEYIGWGAEDQDIIETLHGRGRTLVRAADLLYFHLPHVFEEDWRIAELTAANRARLAQKRLEQNGSSL